MRIAPSIRPARFGACLIAAAAFTIASIGSALPASAAEVPDAVGNITVTNNAQTTPIRVYQTLRITADWAVPDNSAPGDTFSLQLPVELRGLISSFPLNDADGAQFGSCTVDSTAVQCTLSDLVASRPLDVHGTLFFSGRFTNQALAGQTNVLQFDTGLQVATVPVEIAQGVAFGGNGFRKDGSLLADGTVQWYINLPAPVGGTANDLTNVVVTDRLAPALRFVGPDKITLRSGTELNDEGTGPDYDTEVSRTLYSVQIDGQTATINIPLLPKGAYYAIWVETAVLNPTGPFENRAELSAVELTGIANSASTVDFASGGDANGVALDLAPASGTPVAPGAPAGAAAVSDLGVNLGVNGELAATGASVDPAIAGGVALLLGMLMVGARISLSRRTARRQ